MVILKYTLLILVRTAPALVCSGLWRILDLSRYFNWVLGEENGPSWWREIFYSAGLFRSSCDVRFQGHLFWQWKVTGDIGTFKWCVFVKVLLFGMQLINYISTTAEVNINLLPFLMSANKEVKDISVRGRRGSRESTSWVCSQLSSPMVPLWEWWRGFSGHGSLGAPASLGLFQSHSFQCENF